MNDGDVNDDGLAKCKCSNIFLARANTFFPYSLIFPQWVTFGSIAAVLSKVKIIIWLISLHIILISAMFWQGGGKKRLKHQIENIMEVPQHQVDSNAIGKNDDELLHIYYYRDGYSDVEEYEETTPKQPKFR